jgi:hypothetical protein
MEDDEGRRGFAAPFRISGFAGPVISMHVAFAEANFVFPSQSTSMDEAFLQNLRNDLDKTGFGAEMKVLQKMVQHGWLHVGSDAYLDEDEGTFRDIDASGYLQRWCRVDGKVSAIVLIFLAIEVKKSTSPWMIFKPPRMSTPHGLEASDSLIYAANLPCSLFRLRRAMSHGSIVGRQGWFARGIHEAFKSPSDKSRWYSAFVTSCKAAEAIMRREASAENPRGSRSIDLRQQPTYFLVSRPVVVLDGSLVVVELDEAGEVLFSETNAVTYDLRFSSAHCREKQYHIDLVTLTEFPQYLDSWLQRRNQIAAAIHQEAGIKNVNYED